MVAPPTKSPRHDLPPLWVRMMVGGMEGVRGGGGRSENRAVWTKKTSRVWGLDRPDGSGVIVRCAADFWRPGAEESHGRRLRNHAEWARELTRLGIPTADVLRATFHSLGLASLGVVEERLLPGVVLLRKNRDHSHDAAEILARLHAPGTLGACAGANNSAHTGPTWLGRPYPTGSTGAMAWWRGSWGRRVTLSVAKLTSRSLGRRLPGSRDTARRARVVAGEIDRRIRQVLTGSPRWRLCHGDIQPENFRHDAAGTMHLIDLEWMHVGLAEIDLAYAERRLCFLDSGEAAERFFTAYREVGGGECLDRYQATKGTWLALHDLRRAASVERKIRRGRGLRADQTTEEWLERAEDALGLPRGGKP